MSQHRLWVCKHCYHLRAVPDLVEITPCPLCEAGVDYQLRSGTSFGFRPDGESYDSTIGVSIG